jgi:hypothetical protein
MRVSCARAPAAIVTNPHATHTRPHTSFFVIAQPSSFALQT